MGSVVVLWGEPGYPMVALRHLKQPAQTVGPFTVIHDHEQGRTTLHEAIDVPAFVRDAGTSGRTVRDVAEAVEGSTDVDKNAIERARRKLLSLTSRELLIEFPSTTGQATTYVFNGGAA